MLPMWEGPALEELPSDAADMGGACLGGIRIRKPGWIKWYIQCAQVYRNCHWMLPMCAGLFLEKLSLDAADLRGAVPGEIAIGCCRCGRGLPWRNCHRMLPMCAGPALEELSSDVADVCGACPGGIVIGCCRCVRCQPWRNSHRMLPMWEGPSLEELPSDAADV